MIVFHVLRVKAAQLILRRVGDGLAGGIVATSEDAVCFGDGWRGEDAEVVVAWRVEVGWLVEGFNRRWGGMVKGKVDWHNRGNKVVPGSPVKPRVPQTGKDVTTVVSHQLEVDDAG